MDATQANIRSPVFPDCCPPQQAEIGQKQTLDASVKLSGIHTVAAQ